jgi:hypothetical protein
MEPSQHWNPESFMPSGSKAVITTPALDPTPVMGGKVVAPDCTDGLSHSEHEVESFGEPSVLLRSDHLPRSPGDSTDEHSHPEIHLSSHRYVENGLGYVPAVYASGLLPLSYPFEILPTLSNPLGPAEFDFDQHHTQVVYTMPTIKALPNRPSPEGSNIPSLLIPYAKIQILTYRMQNTRRISD